MNHTDSMLTRLPTLYREGELLRSVMRLMALQLDIVDEEALEVQRSHFFDTTLQLHEAAQLAVILAIPPQDWQQLAEYRDWVHALRTAILQRGAVTVEAIEHFIDEYTRLYHEVTFPGLVSQLGHWKEILSDASNPPSDTKPSISTPTFIENPPISRVQRIPTAGGIEPLQQFSIQQRGLDAVVAQFLLVGLSSGPESVPTIVNLTTGQAIGYAGNVPPGARLWITTDKSGKVSAQLEQEDVSANLFSVAGVQPGTPWEEPQVKRPPEPMHLVPGNNDLWFLPLAMYDALGLDRFLLALADLVLTQGRFDTTQFDHALFYQDPTVTLFIGWEEAQPAAFRVTLPAATLVHPVGGLADALQARDTLAFSLDLAVNQLRGAGITSAIALEPSREAQLQRDYLTLVLPLHLQEMGTVGTDRLPEVGGAYDVSDYGTSVFR